MPTATPTLWLADAQVNTADDPGTGAGTNQSASAVIGLADGGFWVAWEDESDRLMLGSPDIIGQRYDALGQRVDGEAVLSFIYNDDAQDNVDLAAFDDGTFLVAYQTTDAAGFGDLENVTVEHDSADAGSGSFNDFRGAANDQDPAVSTFSDGGYALVYANDLSGSNDLTFVYVNAAGVASPGVNIEESVASYTPDIATLASGDVAVVYATSGVAQDVLFKVVNTAGVSVASGPVANGLGAETHPVIATLGGQFVVAWTSSIADGAGNPGIRFTIYSDAGVALPGATNVAANITTTAGAQDAPAVTALADGGFMIAWHDAASGTIDGQRFSAAGAAIGSEVVLLSGTDDYSAPQLSLLDDGRFVVTADRTDGSGDIDVVRAIWDPRDATISGTADADVLTSRRDGASVAGLGGADHLYGFEGKDTLDGGAGADTMEGGANNDAYFVDGQSDQIVEASGQGADLLAARASYALAAGVSVETLRTTNMGATTAMNLTGNEVAQKLMGNAGVNTLDGRGGADVMTGYAGNDTYFVDVAGASGDQVVEAAGGGNDIVVARTSYTLGAGAEIENLRTSSAGATTAIALAGNEFNNKIIGNAGANTLNARGGNDVMTGLGGADAFVFDRALAADNVDHVTDFGLGADKIRLDHTVFTTLSVGALAAAAFKDISAAAEDADDRVLYKHATGALYYDADGAGGAAAKLIAVLDNHTALASADFLVIA